MERTTTQITLARLETVSWETETSLDLSGCDLSDPQVFTQLMNGLRRAVSLSTLTLGMCKLNLNQLSEIFQYVGAHQSISRVDFSGNDVNLEEIDILKSSEKFYQYRKMINSLVEMFRGNQRLYYFIFMCNGLNSFAMFQLAEVWKVHNSIATLGLDGNKFGDDGILALVDALICNHRIISPITHGTGFGKRGVAYLVKAIQESAIVYVDIRSVNPEFFETTNIAGVTQFCDSIVQSTTLRIVDLHFNLIPEIFVENFIEILRQRPKVELKVGYNAFSPTAWPTFFRRLLELLSNNCPVTELHLENYTGGFMGDNEIELLCHALSNNTCIARVWLQGNPNITDASFENLLELIQTHPTLILIAPDNSLFGTTGMSERRAKLLKNACDRNNRI